MNKLYFTKRPIKITETIFYIVYLGIVTVCGIRLLAQGLHSIRGYLAVCALILAVGDAFHLMPRIAAMWDRRQVNYLPHLGLGKLIASITMTLFYVGLWFCGLRLFNFSGSFANILSAAVAVLALVRIVLCLMPQNGWISENPPYKWGIYRNIPFFVIGIIVAALFAWASFSGGGLPYVWALVVLSFACYLPVVLFVHKNAKWGMLMLPKSCAYAAIVVMFLTV